MTQFLEGLDHSPSFQVSENCQKRLPSILDSVEKFMNSRNFSTYFENQILYVVMQSEHFTPKFNYLQYLGILVIKFHRFELHFDLYPLDSDGNYLKAESVHQKTGLSKFCNTISSNSISTNLICDPYSSKFKLNFKYTIEQQNENQVILTQMEDALIEMLQNQSLIKNALEFLELVPEAYNDNFIQVQKLMQRCRYKLFGCPPHYIPSSYEENHKKHLVQQRNPQSTYCWLWETQSRLFLSCLQERIKKDQIKLRQSNFSDLTILKPQKQVLQKLDLMLRSDLELCTGQGERISEEITLTSKQSIKLDFILETRHRKMEELEKIECLSQKCYFKFIRKYVNLVNYDLPSNRNLTFIVQKDQNLTLLNDYVQSNSKYISFETKLHLCWEIVSVGYISLLSMKKFIPNFALQNIYVSNDLSIKLGLVTHENRKASSIQIAQICYFVLYNVRCSANNFKEQNGEMKNREWRKIIKSVDDGESQYQGVSTINFWLKKILLDAVNNQEEKKNKVKRSKIRMQDQSYSRINTDQSSQQSVSEVPSITSELQFFQKLLYVVSLAYQTYSEVFLKHTPQIFDRHVEI